jgi:hypothetical protein
MIKQVGMGGWCLIGMKVEGRHNHLHDEMQYLHRILSFDGVTWIAILASSFIDIFSRLCVVYDVGRCVGVDG